MSAGKQRQQFPLTTDEWRDKHMPQLKEDLETHFKVFCEGTSDEDKETLLRMCVISIRQWAEQKGFVRKGQ